jgi:hypothetical protein
MKVDSPVDVCSAGSPLARGDVSRARSLLAVAVFRFWMRPQLNSATLGEPTLSPN